MRCGSFPDNWSKRIAMDDVHRYLAIRRKCEPAFAVAEVRATRRGGVVKDDCRHTDIAAALGATARVSEAVEDAGCRLKRQEDCNGFGVEVHGQLSVGSVTSELRKCCHVADCGACPISANGGRDFAEKNATVRRSVEEDSSRRKRGSACGWKATAVIPGGLKKREKVRKETAVSFGGEGGRSPKSNDEAPIRSCVLNAQPADDAAAPPVFEAIEEP